VDYTDKLEMSPGVTVVLPIEGGIDTHWKSLGHYDFRAKVDKVGADGFGYSWLMGDGERGEGDRGVDAEDVRASHKVSLFYPKREHTVMSGFTNILRVSDELYQALKSGTSTEFLVDGPDIPPGHEKDPNILPRSIQAVSEETVYIFVNERRVPVRSIKAQTNNGWNYWVLDNPRWPLIVQGDQPFRWKEPRFVMPVAETPPAISAQPPASPKAQSEARRVINQLESKGVATTYAILFDFNKATLKPQSKAILSEIAKYLKSHQPVKLKVEGHTDNVGGSAYNLNLSRRRAEAVKAYLVGLGVQAALLSPAGLGYTKPVASNANARGRALNRRVVFRKLG
jgi:outer membrane protein OmpA-like peptidoglycan-associated protein